MSKPTRLALKLMIHFMGTGSTRAHAQHTRTHTGVVGSTISETSLNQIFMSFHLPGAVGQENKKVYTVAISTFLTFSLPLRPLLSNLVRLGVALMCN